MDHYKITLQARVIGSLGAFTPKAFTVRAFDETLALTAALGDAALGGFETLGVLSIERGQPTK